MDSAESTIKFKKREDANSSYHQIKSLQKNNHDTNVVLRDILNSLGNLPENELKARIERAHELLCVSEQGIQDIRNKFKDTKGSKTIFSESVWSLLDKIEALTNNQGASPRRHDLETMIKEHFQRKDTQIDGIDESDTENAFGVLNVEHEEPNLKSKVNELSTDGVSRHKIDRLSRELRESEQDNDLLIKQMEKSRRDCEYWKKKCAELENNRFFSGLKTDLKPQEKLDKTKTNKDDTAWNRLSDIASDSHDSASYIQTERGKINPYDLIKVWSYDSARLKKKRQRLESKISFLELQSTGYKQYIGLMEEVLKVLDILPRTATRPILTAKANLQRSIIAIYFIICTKKEAEKSRRSKTFFKNLFKE